MPTQEDMIRALYETAIGQASEAQKKTGNSFLDNILAIGAGITKGTSYDQYGSPTIHLIPTAANAGLAMREIAKDTRQERSQAATSALEYGKFANTLSEQKKKEAQDLVTQARENTNFYSTLAQRRFGDVPYSFNPNRASGTVENTNTEMSTPIGTFTIQPEAKALSGEATNKFAGSMQGLRDLDEVRGILSKVKNRAGLILGARYADTPLLNLASGDEARLLDLAMRNLAESRLRAETGAGGGGTSNIPGSEINRVKARFEPKLNDSFDVLEARLTSQENYFTDTIRSLRPGQVLPGGTVPKLSGRERIGGTQDFIVQATIDKLKSKFSGLI